MPDLRWRLQRMDCSQALGQCLARERQVVVRLQVQPELGFHAKEDAQARRGIGGDAALASDDFPDVTPNGLRNSSSRIFPGVASGF